MNKSLIIVAIVCLHTTGYSQKLLSGKIVEEFTNIAVPYASVEIKGKSYGTASDDQGKFILSIENGDMLKKLKISSIGYFTKVLLIDSLTNVDPFDIIIYLTPKIVKLDEVIVKTKPIGPEEMVKEAIDNVNKNYNQQPFNLEFYSKLLVKDTIDTNYNLETIISTYRAGYIPGAMNISKIEHKRETGASPLRPELDKKTKQEHFAYHPTFHVFLIDQIGAGSSTYSVFNPKIFRKLNFRIMGYTQFDKDTVCIINYSLKPETTKDGSLSEEKYSGSIYLAVNNLAIVKHILKIGDNNVSTIIYKRYNEYYYPYSIQSTLGVKEKEKIYKIDHKIFLRKIELENVQIITNNPKNWYIENTTFQKKYWDTNYPIQ